MEPYTLLSALSGHTKNIGLVCTASTSFEQPYAVARKFATLDLISGGRSGWNVVTSGNETEAQNFSKVPHLPKADRYRRGREFVEVVRGLWDSWDEGAFLRDKKASLWTARRCTSSITTARSMTCAGRSTWRARRRASR
jgi:alkanesulfonate monooxygenase SsuD/methylene tetrahydromethanopterin reductase-like flavin-dependent oxidoreductase (luciferase family)